MIFNRTLHPDEANQAFTTGKLLETGHYVYQPQDHHGPTLYYTAAGLQKLAGNTTTATLDSDLLRCTPLLFAILSCVLTFMGLRKLVKARMACIGTLLLATAPFFVFFATDFIQEILLSCFLIGAYLAGLNRKSWWLGLMLGLAFATKETSVISFTAALVTGCILAHKKPKLTPCIVTVAMALLTAITMYSSFCENFQGVKDAFITAPLSYLHRAAGDVTSTGAAWHVHPWYRHFEWVFLSGWRYSALPLLGLFILTFSPKSFLHLYTLFLWILYSLVPYKTPWCDVQLIVPLVLASFTHAERLARFKYLAYALIACQFIFNVGAICQIIQTPDSKEIPCNYANASPEVQEIAQLVSSTLTNPKETDFIAVALPSEDTWPLPWYLRQYSARTGYWTKFQELEPIAQQATPHVLIVEQAARTRAKKLFPTLHEKGIFHIRTGIPVVVFTQNK